MSKNDVLNKQKYKEAKPTTEKGFVRYLKVRTFSNEDYILFIRKGLWRTDPFSYALPNPFLERFFCTLLD